MWASFFSQTQVWIFLTLCAAILLTFSGPLVCFAPLLVNDLWTWSFSAEILHCSTAMPSSKLTSSLFSSLTFSFLNPSYPSDHHLNVTSFLKPLASATQSVLLCVSLSPTTGSSWSLNLSTTVSMTRLKLIWWEVPRLFKDPSPSLVHA